MFISKYFMFKKYQDKKCNFFDIQNRKLYLNDNYNIHLNKIK